MKRILSLMVLSMTTISISAQETYENAAIATEDLNGTARYVGMGGAMDALGADLSTIGTNPAGIGLFRKSQAKVSFGGTMQEGVDEFADAKKTRVSFDQIGFVYSTRSGANSFLNFAFNYHKNRNFGQIINAANSLYGASQNKQTEMKRAEGIYKTYPDNGYIYSKSNAFTQLDYLYYNTLLCEPDEYGNPQIAEDGQPLAYYNEAMGYVYNAYNKGYIGEFDFNLSGNIKDRVYLGLTVGIHSVRYTGYSEYTEFLTNSNGDNVGNVQVSDERKITGTGYNVKAGVIVRPMEYSPFRIGLSVSTPTWYDLKTENYTTVRNNTDHGLNTYGDVSNTYEYKLFTPWKFGLSMGTTVENWLALGASYEYADYSALDPRVNEGEYWDSYSGTYYDESSTDREMKRHTEKTLKGVSTIKLGMEFKPDNDIAIRLGYNYVSPMYQSDGQKSYDNYSPGQYYSSTTAFTNWKSTQRLTCGIGFVVDNFTIDAAYQYSSQKGDFYPFNNMTSDDVYLNNPCDAVSVKDDRHQLLVTLGYNF